MVYVQKAGFFSKTKKSIQPNASSVCLLMLKQSKFNCTSLFVFMHSGSYENYFYKFPDLLP